MGLRRGRGGAEARFVQGQAPQDPAGRCGSWPRHVVLSRLGKWRSQRPLCSAGLSSPRRRPLPRRHCCPGPLRPFGLRVRPAPATGNDVEGAAGGECRRGQAGAPAGSRAASALAACGKGEHGVLAAVAGRVPAPPLPATVRLKGSWGDAAGGAGAYPLQRL